MTEKVVQFSDYHRKDHHHDAMAGDADVIKLPTVPIFRMIDGRILDTRTMLPPVLLLSE